MNPIEPRVSWGTWRTHGYAECLWLHGHAKEAPDSSPVLVSVADGESPGMLRFTMLSTGVSWKLGHATKFWASPL